MNLEEFLKNHPVGLVKQSQKALYSVRLSVPVSTLTSQQLKGISELAGEYGEGTVHVTTRQGLQITNVHQDNLPKVVEELEKLGLGIGCTGSRVRGPLACTALPNCKYGIINAQELGRKIANRYQNYLLQAKFKTAISGCPNACSNPWGNDFGVMGMREVELDKEDCVGCSNCLEGCKEKVIKENAEGKVEITTEECLSCGNCADKCPNGSLAVRNTGYRVVLGGKGGRKPIHAQEFLRLSSEEELLDCFGKVVTVAKEQGRKKERLGAMINRLGWDKFQELYAKAEPIDKAYPNYY